MGGAAMRRVGRAAAALTAALVAATIALAPGPWRSAQARSTGRIASAGARRLVGAPATRAEEASRARALEQLHAHEEQIRAATDFRRPIAGDRATGVDPFLVRGLADGPRAADRAADRFVDRAADRFVGVLRGSSEVVLLDGDLRTIARAPAPRAPTGLTVDDSGAIFVAGELSSEIARYRVAADAIVAAGRIDLGPGRGVRDLAAGPGGVLYAAEARGSRLVTLRLRGGDSARGAGDALLVAARDETPIGRGATRVMRVGPLLLVNCLLEHAVRILRAGSDGRPGAEVARIQHDGPIWAFDAAIVPGQKGDSTGSAGSAGSAEDLILVTAGVEDHPLDRTIGSFGYIDSYLTVYRAALAPAPAPLRPQRLGVTNLSERGIVTPKVVSLTVDSSGGGGRAWVSGYGSEQLASVVWRRFAEPPAIDLAPLPPGTTSLARRRDGALVFADPLLDAWVARAPGAGAPITVTAAGAGAGGEAAGRPPAVRLGEALFFTTVMAPWNRADGATSRFTCETCHFEGGIDGRTHHTGRGDVRATTKPLRGLLANRPYFSRALDPDMATMVNNEFRVAGASSGRDPWFDLRVGDHPWLRQLGVADAEVRAPALRAALISFLAGFTPWPNPVATVAASFTPEQRAGAGVFRDRCEGCHQARLVSDDAGTRVPFAQWEGLILSDVDPLVWGTPDYQKTGVVPYVHERGARVPSLRRVSAKFPYFTNGSAKSLAAVIERARFADGGFAHAGAAAADGDDDALEPKPAADLAAFLDLL